MVLELNQIYKIIFSLLILSIAIGIRFRLNFSIETIPGVNGGYYALLARNILETGQPNYPDNPMIHWMIAGLAGFIRWIASMPLNDSVILAVKLFDTIVPPLIVFPLMGIATGILGSTRKHFWLALPVVAFGTLYLAPVLIFTGDMLKNATGMILLTVLVQQMLLFSRHPGWRGGIGITLSLFLLGLTHFGTLAVGAAFLAVFAALYLVRRGTRLPALRIALLATILILLFLVIRWILHDDPDRWSRFLGLVKDPLRLLEDPYLWVLLEGQRPYREFLLHNFMFMGILSITGIGLLLWRIRGLSEFQKPLFLTIGIMALALSSPLIGMEWALRYQLMAWLPVTLLLLVVIYLYGDYIISYASSAIAALVVLFSVTAGFQGHRPASVSDASMTELRWIRDSLSIGRQDLVVARHGLEWWTGWELGCRTGKEYCLIARDWSEYRGIYLLRQKTGNQLPGHQGTGQFAELPLPAGAMPQIEGKQFILYRLPEPVTGDYYPGELPTFQGEIVSVKESEVHIRARGYIQPVRMKKETLFPGIPPDSLKPGVRADVWGYGRPFSRVFIANTIRAYPIAN